MKLKKLLKNIKYKEIKGQKDIEISTITADSRVASFNGLFIARKGKTFDGSKFIYQAVDAGVKAVITDIYDPFLKNITQIIVDDPAAIEADIAANFYNHSAKKLFKVAITGTNGKTTTSYLLKHILDLNKGETALIGTIEYILGKNKIQSNLTSPDSVNIQKYLNEIKENNLKNVCMEVSSHAIDQNRLKHINFDIAIFTNLTQDHLDYHKTFENYKNAKKKLFDTLDKTAFSIVNIDDENTQYLIKDTKSKIFSYSTKMKAGLQAFDIKYSLKGTSFTVKYKDETFDFFTNLIGRYNVSNILAAISLGIILKIDLNKLSSDLKSFKQVKGRLEKISNNKNFHVFVDFAHSPDAMKNVLLTLKDLKKSRIINVFGCGGNRDQLKRSQMATISETHADITIVTNDNPRNEDPNEIITDIVKGFSKNANYIIETNRKQAIEKAIKLAKVDDIIIITGKGHETCQIFENITIEFDDSKIAKQILS
ncbi:MAG: UDP-N-acetylmuramoyl-L-alanyl-D-glutamate--2,6-diaminopimelate ligase [Candidatus Anoxychlamydiales bacterium]|nr:UDP-N-acetylmuramoyl-L-alanyl-D-glutamate--2,6-diaminopimelate ligase [Candidatus Anoxychlamydiales bacterium]